LSYSWPPAETVPDILSSEAPHVQPSFLVDEVMRRRREFGISRVGSITRLDRVRIPVVQVVRPLALSNAVTQGKGMDHLQATVSALMEALELWAGEVPCPSRLDMTATELGSDVVDLYESALTMQTPVDWRTTRLSWAQGWDLFRNEAIPVPLALVDTIYTIPSPHPPIFPRSTTGLGAGQSLLQALCKAGLEILERDSVAKARNSYRFFERWQVNPASVTEGKAAKLIAQIEAAGLLVGIWRVPAPHDLPIYWCHVMENRGFHELAPLPGSGYACHFTHGEALAGAMLEACQGRLTAIAGAREDITREHYPMKHDRDQLAEWREFLAAPSSGIDVSELLTAGTGGCDQSLQRIIDALRRAGAKRAIAVPIYVDAASHIHVVRMVAPGMQQAP